MTKTIEFSGTLVLNKQHIYTATITGTTDYDIKSITDCTVAPAEIFAVSSYTGRTWTVELACEEKNSYSGSITLDLATSAFMFEGTDVQELAATTNETVYGSTNTYVNLYPDRANRYIYDDTEDLLAKIYESAYTVFNGSMTIRDEYEDFPWLKPAWTYNRFIATDDSGNTHQIVPIAKGYTPGYATFTGAADSTDPSKASISRGQLTFNKLYTCIRNSITKTDFETTITIEHGKSSTNNVEYLKISHYRGDTKITTTTYFTTGDIPAGIEESLVDRTTFAGKAIPNVLGCIAWGRGGNGADGAYVNGSGGGGGAGIIQHLIELPLNKTLKIQLGQYKKVNGSWTNTDTKIYIDDTTYTASSGTNALAQSSTGGAGGTGSYTNGAAGGNRATAGGDRSITAKVLTWYNSAGAYFRIQSANGGSSTTDKSGGGGGASFGKGGNGATNSAVATDGVLGGGGGGGYGYNNYSAGGKGGPAGCILFY